MGIQDSWEQSRRGCDLAIITLPRGREGNSLGFESPFPSPLPVLYTEHLSRRQNTKFWEKDQEPHLQLLSECSVRWRCRMTGGGEGLELLPPGATYRRRSGRRWKKLCGGTCSQKERPGCEPHSAKGNPFLQPSSSSPGPRLKPLLCQCA